MNTVETELKLAHLRYVAPVETVMRNLVIITAMHVGFVLAVTVVHRVMALDLLPSLLPARLFSSL